MKAGMSYYNQISVLRILKQIKEDDRLIVIDPKTEYNQKFKDSECVNKGHYHESIKDE